MHDVLDRLMLACVPLRCPMDLGTKHVVVCARTMCKQCFAESKRVVQLDTEQSVLLICLAKVSEGMDWTLRAESRIEEKDIISTHIIIYPRRGIGEASQGCEIGV